MKDRGHLACTGSGDVMTQGAYLYCCQFCTSNVVVAGGTGTDSIQAVSLDNSEVRLVRTDGVTFLFQMFVTFLLTLSRVDQTSVAFKTKLY